MNIHKSKGLEFSLCYFTGMHNKFTIKEITSNTLINSKYGLIMPYIYENEFGITHSDSIEPLRVYLIETHQHLATSSLLSPLYSIGFMVMLFLFSFAMLVLKGQISAASPIFILATLWATAAAAPLCLYQYVYGLTVTIPLFLVLALSLPNRRKI